MGLLDVINGMMNGPRGASTPEMPGGREDGKDADKGGMSPITMAILGLLAYKAYKHFGSGSSPVPQAETNAPPWGPGRVQGEGSSGGLGGLLGGLGGLLGGGAAGGALSGGLKDMMDQFHRSGRGEVADSWVGRGPNRSISPRELEETLGRERIDELARRTGLSRDELLAELSQRLPEAVDDVTPDGKLPSEAQVRRWL
ncbi:YidB family protein [Rhodoplanes sp. SY1]|uniref:YidB family protein n=1 Tax=Rhodoplanes sp. SY1 TaxID=3166646 RepID=UPI0038B45503